MTYEELTKLWTNRDGLYARSHAGMTDAEREAIIAWRRREAERLTDGDDQKAALGKLSIWAPPAPSRRRY